MNKMKLIFVLSIMGLIVACHTGDYLAYEEPKEGIYFPQLGGGIDEETFRFADWDSSDSQQDMLIFKICGFTADIDRKISLELVDSLTTAIEGEDYVLEESLLLPAKQEYANIPVIRWKRRKENDTRPNELTVGLHIVENEYFYPVTLGSTIVRFTYVKTETRVPDWWKENYLGPWSKGLMYKFIEQYDQLAETNPSAYQSIYRYMGDHFSGRYWPYEVEYLVFKHIITPLYDYYQKLPEPGVVDIPKPKYE